MPKRRTDYSRLIPPLEYEVLMRKLCALFGINVFFKIKLDLFSNHMLSFSSQSKSATFEEEKKSDQTQGHADDRYTGEQLYLILKFSFIRKQ